MVDTDLKRKLSLHFIFHHTPSFINFFGPKAEGRYTNVRLYQMPACLAEKGAFRGGRRWGKTFLIKWKGIQGTITLPHREQLLTTLRRTHVKNVFEPIVQILNSIRFFKFFYKTGMERHSVKRDIVNEIHFVNGHKYAAISVGDDPRAAQIKGQSPARKFVDESQDYPQAASEILSSTEDPEGCQEFWAGVVDGRRDTPFYNVLEKSELFRKDIYRMTRRYDPNYKQADDEKAAEFLGGKQSDRYAQEVDAEHGEPTGSAWNMNDVLACMAEKTDETIMKTFMLTPRDFVHGDNIGAILGGFKPSMENTIIGIDVGDVQPTMIMPFSLENGVWICRNMVGMKDHVNVKAQFEVVDYIVNLFPNMIAIAIDCTSSPWMADMFEAEHEYWKHKLVRVHFNSSISYGEEFIDSVEKQEAYLREHGARIEIGKTVQKKQQAKLFTAGEGRKILTDRKAFFFHNPDIIEEFSSETVSRTKTGKESIDTPHTVHIPEAFRCFALAYWQKIIYGEVQEDEFPEWLMPMEVSSGLFGLPSNRITERAYGRRY